MPNKAVNDNNNDVWYAHACLESGNSNKDWRNLAGINLSGYNKLWSEYLCNKGKERLEGLAGLYLNNKVAQLYAEALESALKAAEAALSIFIPDETKLDSDYNIPPLLKIFNTESDNKNNLSTLLSVTSSLECSNEGEYPMAEEEEIFSKFDPGKEIPNVEDYSDIEAEENVYTHTFNTVFLAVAAILPNKPKVNIYDFSMFRHITLYRLFNYTTIEPRSITATNKGKLKAIGKEDMYLSGKAGKRT